MTGRVVIVTGASSGIGYQVAQELCGGGDDVILACRHEGRAKAAVEKIKQTHPSALATYIHIDLSSLESVRKFVEEFHEAGKCAQVLINNAGIRLANKERQAQYTVDNLELTMSTNFVGHFLLTYLLLDDLKKSAAAGNTARVINVTSSGHDVKACGALSGIQTMDLDNLFLLKPGTYSSHQAYKNSKLANVMFTYELARRLEGTGVTVNAVSPGFVPATDLLRNAAITQRFFQRTILDGVLKFVHLTQTIQQAASSVYEVAVEEKYKEVTGKYFIGTVASLSSEESLHPDTQQTLWELTAGYCHLEGYQPRTNSPPPTHRRRSEGPKQTKDSENTPKKKGKTTPEPEKKHKGKTTPESDKKIRKFFPWNRAKKEEVSNAVEVKAEEERKEEVEKVVKISDDAAIEVELHDGIKAIDLSTDVEEKLGKSEEEKLGHEVKLGKSEEEELDHKEKLGQSNEEKLGHREEEKLGHGAEKEVVKGDEENLKEKPEIIDEVSELNSVKPEEIEEKIAEPEKVSKNEEHLKEDEHVLSAEREGEKSEEKVDDKVEEETVEKAVEKIEEKVDEKIHEREEQMVNGKSEHSMENHEEKIVNLENVEHKTEHAATGENHPEAKVAE